MIGALLLDGAGFRAVNPEGRAAELFPKVLPRLQDGLFFLICLRLPFHRAVSLNMAGDEEESSRERCTTAHAAVAVRARELRLPIANETVSSARAAYASAAAGDRLHSLPPCQRAMPSVHY